MASSRSASRVPVPVPRARILLADDEARVLALFGDVLGAAGHAIDVANNGLELCEKLRLLEVRDDPQRAPPYDLVITDVRMPGVLGTEVLEALAGAEHKVPVIVMSSFVDDDVRAAAKRYGAAAVLEKPVPLPILLDTIEDALAPS